MMLVLMALAIATADLITTSEVHSFLIGRLDDQIADSETQLVGVINHYYGIALNDHNVLADTNASAWLQRGVPPRKDSRGHGEYGHFDETPDALQLGSSPSDGLTSHVSPEDFVEVIDNDGTKLFTHLIGPSDAPTPAPALPLTTSASTSASTDASGEALAGYRPGGSAFEVGSVGKPETQYRVKTMKIHGGIIVVASPVAPTESTLASLAHIEILVSVAVMIILAVLVAWTVRLGLRPLEDMTETADSFAKGDLSRRVRFSDERTEVGRLGRALNGMLVQIERAFSQRQQSEDRLRRFVADASHDLRTPLTSIRGYAELLRKGGFEEEDDRKRALGRIEHEAERMGVLVDDLLLLARLDQGRPLERAPVELAPLVADAVAAVGAADSRHVVSFDTPERVLVQGDAGKLRQAVDNLLRNAVVHTPAGSSVHVEVGSDGQTARVSVIDDGPGIAPEEAEHVFERFFQADPSRTGHGTGLGLSIVAAVAEAHGGRAWVETELGDGCRFHLEVPLEADDPRGEPEEVYGDEVSPDGAGQVARSGAKHTDEDEFERGSAAESSEDLARARGG